jgi:hypothetical protein
MQMRDAMKCWKLIDRELQEVENEIVVADDFRTALSAAGYLRQISSQIDEGNGAEVILYSTQDERHPEFFIEINGSAHSIAYLVADDFPQLLAIMGRLTPLIQLTAADQRADIMASELFERHASRQSGT